MNKQHASSSSPQADVSINKSRLKKYGNNIYLVDGIEFEIELTNLTTIKYLAKIWVNGQSIGSSGLVVRPGEHIFLERFLDEPKRFKFDTYRVDDTEDVRHAIKKNGLLKIEFFEERLPVIYPTHPIKYISLSPYIYNDTTTYGSTYSAPIGATMTIGEVSCYYNNVGIGDTDSLTIETGRIERGSTSSQQFVTVDTKFCNDVSYSYEYKLLPISAKPVEARNIRTYCSECGRRQRSGDRFCPKCGYKF